MIHKGDCFFVLAMLDYRKHLMASYAAMYGGKNSGVPLWDIQFQTGSKYIRVFSVGSDKSRSCHSFIKKDDGSIWKSASWKAPAKNFSRGSIFDSTTWANIRWNGL